MLTGLSDLCKPPVLLAGAAGIVLALRRLAPRQTTVPLLLVGGGVTSFLITSAAGMAVITRYLALAALGVTLFAGWFMGMGIVMMARRASRQLLVAGAGLLLLSGAVWSGAHLHLGGATNEMTLRTHVEAELRSLLHGGPIARARRCDPSAFQIRSSCRSYCWTCTPFRAAWLPAAIRAAHRPPARAWHWSSRVGTVSSITLPTGHSATTCMTRTPLMTPRLASELQRPVVTSPSSFAAHKWFVSSRPTALLGAVGFVTRPATGSSHSIPDERILARVHGQ